MERIGDDMSEQPPDGPDDAEDAEKLRLWREAASSWRDDPELAAQRGSEKQRLLGDALERGKTQVRVDARRPGCRVPDHIADECQLVLNLSWRFPHANMVVNERGLAATLRFGGQPFRCVVPWSALWGVLVPGAEQLRVWPVDLPEELGGPPANADAPEPPAVEPVKPRLSVVSENEPVVEASPEAPTAPPPDEPPPTPPTAPRAPWLRVVK